MEKALEILKKEYPLICDMSFEWGWKSCEEAMKTKTCEWCNHSKVTINSVICGKNGTYKEADDYCKYFMQKDNA